MARNDARGSTKKLSVYSLQFTEIVEITSPSVDEWLVMTRGGVLRSCQFTVDSRQ